MRTGLLNDARKIVSSIPEIQRSEDYQRCPRCDAGGIPGRGRHTGKWLVVHIGCGGETIAKETREAANRAWKAQLVWRH